MREVAATLDIADWCLHRWRSRDLLERGLNTPSAAVVESAALAAANQQIRELEDEIKILRKAAASVEEVVPPKRRFEFVTDFTGEGVPVKRACLALGMSSSGYYDARSRPPSAREIRHAWLTDLIGTVHQASRRTYGSPRVHAELVQAHGTQVGCNTVALLMRRQGLSGLPLRRRAKGVPTSTTVTDLVKRDFCHDDPNQLWVTDIERHEALTNRAVVKGHRPWPVAAGRVKQRAV